MYRRRRAYVGKRYSFETTNVNVPITQGAESVYTIVPPVESYGKRKVKNFTIQIGAPSDLTQPLVGALIYIPEGTSPTGLNVAGNDPAHPSTVASLYEPSQNVICSFVILPGQTQPLIKRVSLARNLDSSDKIVLCLKPYAALDAPVAVSGTISYAIKY